jgi:uncharacterized protein (UPF0261 family)
VLGNHGDGGRNFTLTIPFDKLSGVMTAAEVADNKANGTLTETPDRTGFYLAGKTAARMVELAAWVR